MKKNWRLLSLLLAALMLLALAGCGASSQDAAAPETAGVNGYAYTEAATEEYEDWLYDDEFAEEAAVAPEEAPVLESQTAEAVTEGTVSDLAEKIIYTADAEIETTEFDNAVEAVYALMDRYGAFMENSSVTGSDIRDTYNGYRSDRTADFTLRVPREKYAAMTGALDTVGNVTYLSHSADNITAQYTDVQSRLSAYQTEEDRLLELLGKAETVEDMITVESRLSEVRYEKEWLTSQLRNWDNQVHYSTVRIHLNEVRILTPEPEPEPETYWQQVGRGFMDTLKAMGRFFKGLFRVFVAALPVLIPLAALVTALVLLVRRKEKQRREARAKAAEIKARAERPETPDGPVPPAE